MLQCTDAVCNWPHPVCGRALLTGSWHHLQSKGFFFWFLGTENGFFKKLFYFTFLFLDTLLSLFLLKLYIYEYVYVCRDVCLTVCTAVWICTLLCLYLCMIVCWTVHSPVCISLFHCLLEYQDSYVQLKVNVRWTTVTIEREIIIGTVPMQFVPPEQAPPGSPTASSVPSAPPLEPPPYSERKLGLSSLVCFWPDGNTGYFISVSFSLWKCFAKKEREREREIYSHLEREVYS